MRRSWGEQQECRWRNLWRKKGGSLNEWKITDIWLKVQELQTVLRKGQRMPSLLAGPGWESHRYQSGWRGKRQEGRGKRLGLCSCRESHRIVQHQAGPGAAFSTAPSPPVPFVRSYPQSLFGTSSFSVKTPFSVEIQQCP